MTNLKYSPGYKNKAGFTIVELLIVVVVIAILAAITIVAYNGIQNRAKQSAAQSAASQVTKKVMSYAVLNADQYPATLAAVDISNSGDTSYQYSVNNSGSSKTYCVTTTVNAISYFSSNAQTAPAVGACPGHGANGVATITNLIKNPTGVGTVGWFGMLGGTTDTANVSFGSRSDWHRFSAPASGNRIMRIYVDLSDLENAATYTASALFANDSATTITFSLDFSDEGVNSVSLPAGETRRVYSTGTRATYDSIYRFVDVDGIPYGRSLLISELMVTKGTTQYNFGHGASPGWVWNGTTNNATSTGPIL